MADLMLRSRWPIQMDCIVFHVRACMCICAYTSLILFVFKRKKNMNLGLEKLSEQICILKIF